VKEVEQVQPIMVARCPNCHYTDEIDKYEQFWQEFEDGKTKRMKICPKCGVVFAHNIRYIGDELYRVAEGFGLIGEKDGFSK